MKWMNKGSEFNEVAELISELVSTKNFVIWGAGALGDAFLKEYCAEFSIDGFIDSKSEKQGKKFCNLSVYHPDYLLENQDVIVLVSAGWTKDIFSALKQYGFHKNENCFHIDEFSYLYNFYEKNNLVLSNLSIPFTEKCSLKCKHCYTFNPYWEKPVNFQQEDILKDLELLFSVVDKINVLGIVTGDTMMHPKFYEILKEICMSYYGTKITTIEVFTNAVILPKERELELFQKYQIYIRFSNYGKFAAHRQKIPEMIALLEGHQIKYDHVQFDYWLDCGYPQESNGVVGEENLIAFSQACDRRSGMFYLQGEFYYCPIIYCADRFNYCEKQDSDLFNIKKSDSNSRAILLEYLLGYSEKGYYEYCKKCNGTFNVNQKKVPVGEQLV